MSSAQHLLDRVQSLPTMDGLAADPGQYAARLAAELPPTATLADLETRDAALAAALHHIDELAVRVMRIRLDHVLASDTSIGMPTRRVFASTIVSYDGKLPLLRERVRDVAARGGANADLVAGTVIEAARQTLELREALRTPVLDLVSALASASVADADRHARDRKLDDAQRKRWSAARRDLETLVQNPASILAAPMTERLAAWPEQLDEPAPEPEVSFADMIELD